MEVNPLAGLHPEHSDLPILATKVGLSYVDLIGRIVASAEPRVAVARIPRPGGSPSLDRTRMKIAILHNAVADSDSAADRDVLVQVQAVEEALRKLGHQPRRVACTLNLESIEESLTADRPAMVFNLVESLGGSDRLAHLAAVLLDDLDLPYTGTHSAALHLTNNKPAAKVAAASGRLADARLGGCQATRFLLATPYIIKAVWEHASVGLDDHAIVRERRREHGRRVRSNLARGNSAGSALPSSSSRDANSICR